MDTPNTVHELSPFTVVEASDSGYMATSTLAGTRIRTELKDLGAAISVYTADFMEDIAATDAGTLLSYATNSEVGGEQGNFSGAEAGSTGRVSQNEERTDPQFNQRIRGLGSADLTRGFFLTEIPFDSYNTERVEMSRGPNSLLFGIGSPGGVMNNGTKRALHRRAFQEVKFSLNNYGTQRAEVDINVPLVPKRAAVRVAGLYEDAKFKQDPAWKLDRRSYAALDVVLFENRKSAVLGPTQLRANGEVGKISGSPVQVVPPSVAYHGWFEPTPRSIQQYSGIAPPNNVVHPSEGGTWRFQETYNPFLRNTEPSINTNTHPSTFRLIGVVFDRPDASVASVGGGTGLQGYTGLIPWVATRDTLDSTGLAGTPGVGGATGSGRVNPTTEYHTNSPYAEPFAAGFTVPSLQNRDVFDYWNNVYSGGLDYSSRKFDAYNVALEQSFFKGKLAFELAYDKQHYETWQDFFFSGGQGGSDASPYDIYVSIAEYLPNGQPNPNLGRAYTRVRSPTVRSRSDDRETFRFTAFGELNFRERNGWLLHLGLHRFTGLYNDYVRNTASATWYESWDSSTFNISDGIESPTLNHERRGANFLVFTSDSLLGLASMDDVRLSRINISRPQPGDTYRVLYADTSPASTARRLQTGEVFLNRFLNDTGVSRSKIQAKAISWQSYLFNDHLVGLLGYREDDTKNYARVTLAEAGVPMRLPDGSFNPDFTRLSSTPSLEEKGDTVTWSLVGRYPQALLGKLPWSLNLQVHYAESENFNPVGLRNDALGGYIPQPTGSTREHGFLISTANNRFSAKFNWFQTKLNNVTAAPAVAVPSQAFNRITAYRDAELRGVPFSEHLVTVSGDPAAFPVQDYETFYRLMLEAVPAAVYENLNPHQFDSNGDGVWDRMQWDSITALRSTQDRVAKGFEVELVANPTRDWRIMMNVSKQESIQSNTATLMAQLVEDFTRSIATTRIGELRALDSAGTAQLRSINEIWLTGGLRPIRAAVARDNTVSNEQRKWRVTAVTNYSFSRGPIKGLGLGAAARWEDKAATGYVYYLDPDSGVPIPDVGKPYFDDGLFTGDCWVSYRRKIWNDKVDWRVQLNVRNAFGDMHDIPVKTNPDGQVAVIRSPNPRVVTLSNTFRF